jgi:hypothetical protein
MSFKDGLSRNEGKRATGEVPVAQSSKLSTGEYRQLLRQQYERLAQHQQVIEAENHADNSR